MRRSRSTCEYTVSSSYICGGCLFEDGRDSRRRGLVTTSARRGGLRVHATCIRMGVRLAHLWSKADIERPRRRRRRRGFSLNTQSSSRSPLTSCHDTASCCASLTNPTLAASSPHSSMLMLRFSIEQRRRNFVNERFVNIDSVIERALGFLQQRELCLLKLSKAYGICLEINAA